MTTTTTSAPLAAVLGGYGTVTLSGGAAIATARSPGPEELGLLDVGADVADRAVTDRIGGAVSAGAVLGVAVPRRGGWVRGAAHGHQVVVDHGGHRRVLAGPVAEVVTDPVRVGLVPVGSALRPPAALIGLPDGTRSGAGVWLRTAEVLGEGRGDVEGTRCACGAFVHPLTVLCAACHQVLRPPRRLVVEPTVPVARVVLDDARVLPLCGSVLIGREPAADPLVGEGRVAALALTDSQRSVSRAHAVLWVDGWDVVLEDRQAANGTAVRPPSSAGWTVLVPGGSVRLLPETEVQIGRRTFRLTT